MPDWITNGLSLEGTADEIATVKQQLGRAFVRRVKDYSNSTDGQTNYLVRKYPYPIFALWNISNPLEEYMDSRTNEFTNADSTHEFDADWYRREWGTPSEVAVYDGQEYPTTLLNFESEKRLAYQFDTAWYPCVNAICTLAIRYQSIEIVYDYEFPSGEGSSLSFRGYDYKVLESYKWKCPECDYVEKEEPKEFCQNCGFENDLV